MTRHEFETQVQPLLDRLAKLEERLATMEGIVVSLQAEHQPLFLSVPDSTAPLNVSSTFAGSMICQACGLLYPLGTQHICQPKTTSGGLYLVQ